MDLPLIASKSLELGTVLGKGATATAFRSSFNGKSCAAKVVKSEDDLGNKLDKIVLAEIAALSKVGTHPNIVQFHGVCLENPAGPIIVMELVEGKDLENYFSSLRPGFELNKETIQKWSLDLLSALNFLHDRDPIIIHCDIKPANLLMTRCRSSLKLTDFGISKSINRDQRRSCQLKANEGSPAYLAPELLSKSKLASYTEKSDIYSASLVIFTLLTGRRPEHDVKVDPRWRPTTMISRMRWRKLSDLLERMWAHDPEQRPSAADCAALLRALDQAGEDDAPQSGCYGHLMPRSTSMRVPRSPTRGGGCNGDGGGEATEVFVGPDGEAQGVVGKIKAWIWNI